MPQSYLTYPLCLAGSYQGPVLAEDAILDKTRAVLWHNYKNYIWQKKEETTQKPIKNEMTESYTSPARASGWLRLKCPVK